MAKAMRRAASVLTKRDRRSPNLGTGGRCPDGQLPENIARGCDYFKEALAKTVPVARRGARFLGGGLSRYI